MKKLVLTSACSLAIAGAAFAQGTVNWNSISPAQFTAETNTTVYSPLFGGGAVTGGPQTIGKTVVGGNSFYYELLYNTAATQQSDPTTLAALGTWSDAGLAAVNSSTVAGGATALSQSSDATVPFTTAESILLVGWSANLGTTWSAAWASLNAPGTIVGTGFIGLSSTGYIAPNAPGVSPGQVFVGGGAGEIDSLLTQLDEVKSVPEPSTIALGAMGALSLLALRRKKA